MRGGRGKGVVGKRELRRDRQSERILSLSKQGGGGEKRKEVVPKPITVKGWKPSLTKKHKSVRENNQQRRGKEGSKRDFILAIIRFNK